MAALGLPGMSGFVSEFMIFVGAFGVLNKVLVGISVLGVVLGATYMLRMVQKVFLGEFNMAKWGGLTDINLREIISVAPLAVLPGRLDPLIGRPGALHELGLVKSGG